MVRCLCRIHRRPRLFAAIALCFQLGTTANATAAEPDALQFSGRNWVRKHGEKMGPGPNSWDRQNVWVDDAGRLHLKIAQRDGRWTCAEVITTDVLHHGSYQFQTIGRLDQLDRNVVLGLFNYPSPDVGPDTTHEIDIEFARWGQAGAPVGNFTVWPVKEELKQTTYPFEVRLGGDYTTHRFDWRPNRISFASLHGHHNDDSSPIAKWVFDRKPARSYISTEPMRVHLNLWLFQGRPPADGKEIEIVLKEFQHRPLKPSN